jgi:hypothetical protein
MRVASDGCVAWNLAAPGTLREYCWIKSHESVMLFSAGSGHKYCQAWDGE